jgi:hypothetical protein
MKIGPSGAASMPRWPTIDPSSGSPDGASRAGFATVVTDDPSAHATACVPHVQQMHDAQGAVFRPEPGRLTHGPEHAVIRSP